MKARQRIAGIAFSALAFANTADAQALADSVVRSGPNWRSGQVTEAGLAGVGGARTPGGAMPVLKSRAVAESDAPSTITVRPCSGCGADSAPVARPLLSALPAGESYEIRVLKSAVSGFRLRASEVGAAPFPEERLRIRISRQHIGVAWEAKF